MGMGMLKAHNPGAKTWAPMKATSLRYCRIKKDTGSRVLTSCKIVHMDWLPKYLNYPSLILACSCPTLSTECTETAVEQQGSNSNFKMMWQRFGKQSVVKF
eukprot:15366744-Ditylum_brightwellii.AAC.1